MTSEEKYLYHQVHPLKLLTDWGAGLLALYFFWKKELLLGAVLAVVLPLVVSGLLIRFASLEDYATSGRGRFVKEHMTRAREILRLLGYLVMAFGAWRHHPWVIVSGLLVIVLAWLGLGTRKSSKSV